MQNDCNNYEICLFSNTQVPQTDYADEFRWYLKDKMLIHIRISYKMNDRRSFTIAYDLPGIS